LRPSLQPSVPRCLPTRCCCASGDGAGILLSIPDDYFSSVMLEEQRYRLPEPGHYAVGQVFLPADAKQREQCKKILETTATELGHETLAWRTVPVTSKGLGKSALSTEPIIEQWFIAAEGKLHIEVEQQVPPTHPPCSCAVGPSLPLAGSPCSSTNDSAPCCCWWCWLGTVQALSSTKELTEGLPPLHPCLLQMYVLRKLIENTLRAAGLTDEDCYFCSLSSKTIVYKGQLTPEQVRGSPVPVAPLPSTTPCFSCAAPCSVGGSDRPQQDHTRVLSWQQHHTLAL
jgi:hypothetical protein